MTRRLLLVHAHPDDESIFTGILMAKSIADGDQVTLVTCTGGELGEIVQPAFAHLTPDELAVQRAKELADALAILGVTDHHYLGGAGRYRDSGMKWAADGNATVADDVDDRAFWRADLEHAAAELATIIDEVEPHVVVTYDPTGGYGHPDHVQAHRVTHRAVELAETQPEVWWISDAAHADVTIAAPELLDRKLAAMRAHVTQIAESFFDLHDDWGAEHFHRPPLG